jgi:VanZ family protein
MKTFLGMPREWLQYPYHFGAYFILALLFRRCFSPLTGVRRDWRPAALSLMGCAAVSVASELIQFYVPTRTPAVRDIAVDQSGAMLGLTLMRIFTDKLFRLGQ